MFQNNTNPDLDTLCKEANDRSISSERLKFLLKSEFEVVRGSIALNISTPKEILNLLLLDKSEYVQVCLRKRKILLSNGQNIHPTAIISKNAQIASDVIIGPYTIIYDNVIIYKGTVIESHCEIGHPATTDFDLPPLVIGENTYIRSHSVFYEGSSFGQNLVTGHRVTVRENTLAGKYFQIGTLCDIQGHCNIGDFVRFHSNVHIGQLSKIDNFVWIFPYVVLTNDPHPPSNVQLGVKIENYAVIATMSTLLPGITIKNDSLVGAHSLVSKDVEAHSVVAGSPAKFICFTNKIKLKDTKESAYPWRRHFHRGYLSEDVTRWVSEFSKK